MSGVYAIKSGSGKSYSYFTSFQKSIEDSQNTSNGKKSVF